MGEIYGICSLIHFPDYYLNAVRTGADAQRMIEDACGVQRGYGQCVTVAFHPSLRPDLPDILASAGFRFLIEWPSGHSGDNPMQLWGALTGQEPH